jgi:hypothetical protein
VVRSVVLAIYCIGCRATNLRRKDWGCSTKVRGEDGVFFRGEM